ncbi:MAG TPA: Smr/MutS family protein [Lacunisphaera sp.]|nr:Smr/MutS family protein [Lacunisphaera sp.]
MNPPRRGRVLCRLISPRANDGVMTDDDPTPPVAIPITGELDLHTFRPAEIGSLLEGYFAECRTRGIRRVRVVHGKGTGTLRATVEAQLRRSPAVVSFGPGDESSGGWGATWVTLMP